MKPHDRDVGTSIDLMKYRLDRAKNDLKSARVLLDNEDYIGANNRAYYAVFHAISAVNALDNKSYKRHKDVIGNFNKNYVNTEIFPKNMGHRIAIAEEIRHNSDYDDFYIASKEKSLEQIETAKELIELIEKYCLERINKNS